MEEVRGKWAVICAPSMSRDYLGAAYIAKELESYGLMASVISGSIGKYRRQGWRNWIAEFRPDVVLLSDVSHAYRLRSFLNKNKSRSREYRPDLIVVPSEYGRYEAGKEGNYIRCTYPNFKPEYSAELVCCMSENDKLSLLDTYPNLDASSIVVTGHPKYDYFRSNEKVDRGRRMVDFGIPQKWCNKKIVTIASRFQFTEEAQADQHRKFVNKAVSVGMRTIAEQNLQTQFLRSTRNSLVDATKRLATAFPDTLFIYKIHPAGGEIAEPFKEEFSEFTNIIVLPAEVGFIGQLFEIVDAHIHVFCTTGLDSTVAGVPTINFCPSPDNELPRGFAALTRYRRISDASTNEASELIKLIGNILQGKRIGENSDEDNEGKSAILKKCGITDSQASKRIAREVVRFSGQRIAKGNSCYSNRLIFQKKILARLTTNCYPNRYFPPYDILPFRLPIR